MAGAARPAGAPDPPSFGRSLGGGRLNGLGYSVDEVWLAGRGTGAELHVHAVVALRRHGAAEVQRLTGLQVGEGQATVLLGDLRTVAGEAPAAWTGARVQR